jgi:hypothetical protein
MNVNLRSLFFAESRFSNKPKQNGTAFHLTRMRLSQTLLRFLRSSHVHGTLKSAKTPSFGYISHAPIFMGCWVAAPCAM